MFDNLSNRIEKAFKNIKGQGKITELNVTETLKEIRRALIDADVNYKVAKEFTDSIKTIALGKEVIKSVSPGQMLTKIVHDQLVELLGGASVEINTKGKPGIVLISGLQGSGKTTFTGKLARRLKKEGKRPLMVACDVYRPAAIDQLETLGKQISVDVYSDRENKNPVSLALAGLKFANANGFNPVIIDTAGRLAVDEAMMDEITEIKNSIKPTETLFVVDAMTGQDAVNTAKTFNERLNIDGVVLTKLDGDTRGGAAISIKKVVNKPLKFVSNGEKLEALEVFHPDRMAGRILGMGDVVSLVERAQDTIDEEEAARLEKRLRKNKFDFEDFLSQIKQIKKMGNVKDLLGMIPGVGNKIKDADIDDDAFNKIEALIFSMTPYERQNPKVLNHSRKQRIVKGSGSSIQELNRLIQQFSQMQKMIKGMNKSSAKKMIKRR